jgi:hypothetical protein
VCLRLPLAPEPPPPPPRVARLALQPAQNQGMPEAGAAPVHSVCIHTLQASQATMGRPSSASAPHVQAT